MCKDDDVYEEVWCDVFVGRIQRVYEMHHHNTSMIRTILFKYARKYLMQLAAYHRSHVPIEELPIREKTSRVDDEEVQHALARLLFPSERQVIELVLMQGMSIVECAEILGISRPTIYRFLESGKRKLKNHFTFGQHRGL